MVRTCSPDSGPWTCKLHMVPFKAVMSNGTRFLQLETLWACGLENLFTSTSSVVSSGVHISMHCLL